MARHVMVRSKDGRAWAVRTGLTNAGEDPLRFWEEVITEQYDRIQELESRPSRLALYGRLIEKYLNKMFLADMVGDMGKSVEMACKIGEVITRMKREENQ